MYRDWMVQLEDIQQAIQRIRSYVTPLDYAAFISDAKTQDAVIRNLEIVGEAVRVLPDEVKARAPNIAWRKIAALRNILSHEYFGVNMAIVWILSVPSLMNCTKHAAFYAAKICRNGLASQP